MKKYRLIFGLVVAMLLSYSVAANAQSQIFASAARTLGFRGIVLDDGSLHAMTIITKQPLPNCPVCNQFPIYTMAVPPFGNPPAAFVTEGTLDFTMRFDTTAWLGSSNLMNNNTNVSMGGALISATTRLTLAGSTADATAVALNVTNFFGASDLYARNDRRIGVNSTAPGSTLSVGGSVDIGAGFASTPSSAAITNGLLVQGRTLVGANGATPAPSNMLGVVNNLSIGSGYAGTAAPANGMIVQGNVGIGTNAPAAGIDVQGSTTAGNFTGNTVVMQVRTDQVGSTGNLNHDVHFLDFNDGNNKARGDVEGQDGIDYINPTTNPDFIITTAELVGGAVAAAAAAADLEAGLIVEEVVMIAQYTAYNVANGLRLGVSYQSAGADYAEWLPLKDPSENISHGDIVGVFGGRISKNLVGAEQIFAVSTAPAVVGNEPGEDQEKLYRKVGFLGQLQVKVRGVVHEDDYIIASGNNDGTGIAVRPENMRAEQFGVLLGKAWASSNQEGLKYIRVAIGMNSGKLVEYTKKQDKELSVLRMELENLKNDQTDLHVLKAKLDQIERIMDQSESSITTLVNATKQ